MKLGLISDIHEDIKRLEMTISKLDSLKCDKIICLGDFVGYSVPYYAFLWSRNSSKVIQIIKNKCAATVVGNHDLYAIQKLPEHQAGFEYPKNWYSLDYQTRNELSKDKIYLYENNELSALLSKDDKYFIDKLPEFFVGDFDGVKILFSHYAYPDLVGTTTFEPKSSDDIKNHLEFMQKLGCGLGISGHDHKEGIMRFTSGGVETFPFGKVKISKETPTWFHIPGVVNGSFANGFAIFDTESFELEVIPLNSERHVLPEWRKL